MRTPVRHISYGIRHYPVHTLLSRMYGTITTLVPLYLVFQDFLIDPNRLSSRWSSSMHGTSVLLTHFFDSKHMDVNDSATLMLVSFCINKSKDWSIDMAERTWLNEPYHDTLYNGLLVGPTKMVTGAFKLALWKTIIIHSLHAWVACKQAIICTGRVTVRRTRNSWVYMISNSSVQSDSRNWKFANKNTYKRSNRIPREIWLSWRSILGTNK